MIALSLRLVVVVVSFLVVGTLLLRSRSQRTAAAQGGQAA